MRKMALFLMSMVLLAMAAGVALAADYPSKNFECIAPAGPGGGWDTTMRMVAKVLTEKGLIKTAMPVVNKPGGGGGVALTYMQRKKGDPYSLIVYSPPLILINLTGQSKLGYKDVTPISMLINDFGAFAVPKNSPYNTIDELFDALKKDPKSVKIGGTSSMGSMDHVQFMVAAKAAGVSDLTALQYIAFQGGEGLASLMGAHIDVLSTGMAELVGPKESGDIKVLAVTAPKRIPTGPLSDVPTLKERGIDAEYVNWRGIFGAPGMPEAEKKFMADALKQMAETPEWKEICARNGWVEAYMTPDEFGAFLDKVNEDNKVVLEELGLLQ
ncbi:tripartite tricarboxylate transporter substrate binding protein [Synergistaceae bacterium OttesenSCG-928-I11]|nr:tripartite tricarboxylate transporter substrate binding protein [Synergistaceae bacterium OttesenSCG-928-I11]